MDDLKEENKPLHPDEIRRPFKVNLEARVAKRFIAACQKKQLFVRETLRDMMSEFADKVLGDKID